MVPLAQFIQERATEDGFSLADAQIAAKNFKLSLAKVEIEALKNNVMPTRYIRNNLTCDQQLRLFQSKVSVIGCGGLGGTAAALLARIGVGHVHLVDPDIFEEHNLNRQRFCTINTLGLPKAEVTASSLPDINPAVSCTHGMNNFVENDIVVSEIIVDCLDSVNDRRLLADLCREHDLPLVHGAVKEWYGQLGIATPENYLISTLYPRHSDIQSTTSPKVIAPTVSHLASLQVIEVCKSLLQLPTQLSNHWVAIDLKTTDFDILPS